MFELHPHNMSVLALHIHNVYVIVVQIKIIKIYSCFFLLNPSISSVKVTVRILMSMPSLCRTILCRILNTILHCFQKFAQSISSRFPAISPHTSLSVTFI